jgi:hypothetical protein
VIESKIEDNEEKKGKDEENSLLTEREVSHKKDEFRN